MPVYSIRNNETQDEFEVTMKYSELVEYLVQNPKFQQIYTKFPGVVDSVRIGVKKADSSFKDVLSKAKSAHKHSNIDF